MSALMIDELYVPQARLRVVQAPASVSASATASRRPAPCEAGVAIVERPSGPLQLTDRGIAVVLTLFVGLFLAGVVVLVTAFLQVSDAPIAAQAGATAAVAISDSGR